jgi:DNA-binding MarR family transcriptional regulator
MLQPTGILTRVSDGSYESENPALVEAWRDVLECHARVSCALEKELQREHGLGVSEFEVLERLMTKTEESCRMQELSDSVHLSQSALSRLVGRLEADGLVERAMCTNDRRGIYAVITPAGRDRYEAARPTHRRVLAETMPAGAAR